MAVVKKAWLDQAGVGEMSTLLYKSINTRIRERIATAVTDGTSGTPDSRNDDNHTLSAKVILGLTDAIEASIGDSEDVSTDDTVYGYINGEIGRVEGIISGLTHLTYQVVTGPITDVQNPAEDVIYLQHDADSYAVGNDGYLLNSQGTHAQYTDESGAEPVTYEAWVDSTDGKIYKMVGGVKGAELQDDDPIFDNVALVEDTTYNLYIWARVPGSDPVTHEWLCVGDTEIALDNYWSKTDVDVAALQNLIMEPISSANITTAVQTAFNNTDPYAGSGSYIWGS